MNEKLSTLLSGFCTPLSALAERHGVILLLCCAFILIDLATGLARAKVQGTVNSSAGYKGFWRKISLLLTLAFGVCLDLFLSYLSTLGLFPVSTPMPISLTIGIYLSVNECISICENLSASGVKMPRAILKALQNAQTYCESSNATSTADTACSQGRPSALSTKRK